MYIKNVSGSSRFAKPRGYSSWLAYWEAQMELKAKICSVEECKNKELVGAHVQKVYSNDKKWYIVPLCKSCNQRTDTFCVSDKLLVPVPSNL
jgi:hypothetical protein